MLSTSSTVSTMIADVRVKLPLLTPKQMAFYNPRFRALRELQFQLCMAMVGHTGNSSLAENLGPEKCCTIIRVRSLAGA